MILQGKISSMLILIILIILIIHVSLPDNLHKPDADPDQIQASGERSAEEGTKLSKNNRYVKYMPHVSLNDNLHKPDPDPDFKQGEAWHLLARPER